MHFRPILSCLYLFSSPYLHSWSISESLHNPHDSYPHLDIYPLFVFSSYLLSSLMQLSCRQCFSRTFIFLFFGYCPSRESILHLSMGILRSICFLLKAEWYTAPSISSSIGCPWYGLITVYSLYIHESYFWLQSSRYSCTERDVSLSSSDLEAIAYAHPDLSLMTLRGDVECMSRQFSYILYII